ncbi:MAG TPA: hypothetical protein VFJ80_08330 [Candidatus Limnocylindrales bacterium]|nr:hypothetical protein [Candidatus Limnocylindrales bacterium]
MRTRRTSLAALALVALAAFATPVAMAAEPANNCGDATCQVGAAGTGGEQSDGAAQGFRLEGASTRFVDSNFTNSGNDMAGHITISGASSGTASGAFTPQGVVVGHCTGVLQGIVCP